MDGPQAPEIALSGARISELLHATLHAVAGPNSQIHRITALLETKGLSTADAALWLSHLSTATRKLDDSLAAVRRYVQVFDLPRECRRFPLGEAVPPGICAVSCDELPEVEADPRRVQLIFHELLSNAAKFCETPEPRARVFAARDQGRVVVSVADNGIGIEPGQSERIFRPFVQLRGDRYPGAGMGLAIARALVETWNGRIWMESTPGEGSIFRFTL